MFVSHNHFPCHPTLTSVWTRRYCWMSCVPARFFAHTTTISLLSSNIADPRNWNRFDVNRKYLLVHNFYSQQPVSYQSMKSVRVFVCLNSIIRCTALLDLSTPYYVNPMDTYIRRQIWNVDIMRMRIASYVQDMIPKFRSFLVHLSHPFEIQASVPSFSVTLFNNHSARHLQIWLSTGFDLTLNEKLYKSFEQGLGGFRWRPFENELFKTPSKLDTQKKKTFNLPTDVSRCKIWLQLNVPSVLSTESPYCDVIFLEIPDIIGSPRRPDLPLETVEGWRPIFRTHFIQAKARSGQQKDKNGLDSSTQS